MSSSRAQTSRATTGRAVAWTLGALLIVAVIGAAWIGVRGMLAYQHLQSAQRAASTLAADLADPSAAAPAMRSITDDTAAAHALTDDPVWQLAEGLPWIGPQLAAVGTIGAAADDLSTSALQPLAEVASSFSIDSLRPQDGAIDVSVIAGLQGAAEDAATGVGRASATVASIDRSRLLPQVAAPVAEVQGLLQEVAAGADALARASALMPAMLGADGPRSYLVLFQNNAEWRSLGGIVGATAVVSTDAGRMSLTAQSSSGDFAGHPGGVIPLPDDVRGVYDTRPAQFIQNATQVADFSLAASIAREMWAQESGAQVDGVLSIDPVALSYLLEATGPVDLPTGDVLTSENAVSLLLNEVYLRYERPADQDAFFEVAAAAVFQALSSGGADPAALVAGLTRAGDENRLLLWSSHPDEQAVLDGTTLQGALPVTDSTRTSFGVYLNDATGSKMDYYVDAAAGTAWCPGSQGDSRAQLDVQLRSTAPADAASLPRYITGGEAFGVPAGSARTVMWIYLPLGSRLVSATASDGNAIVPAGTDGGRDVLAWNSELAPGQKATASIIVQTARTADLAVRLTPTVHTSVTPSIAQTCEIPG